MIKSALTFLIIILVYSLGAQTKFSNAVIIAQFDKPEDRYAIEVALTDIFSAQNMHVLPMQNILKQGGNPLILCNDSVQKMLKNKGFDTYLIVNVRGYDRRFKPSESLVTFCDAMDMTSIYKLYRDEATSVSFEFLFFQKNQIVFRDILKCGNISDRNSTLKRFKKKLPKRMKKKWN
jgi:hypothetical protein